MKIKILDTRDYPSTDPARVGKFDAVITYQVDAFRSYIITMPKEEFTETKVKEKITADLKEREKWRGKEIEI